MAQVITRCRLTGHYMFMGMDADPKEFARTPGPFTRKFCPFCACEHLWHKEDSKFLAPKLPVSPGVQKARSSPRSISGAKATVSVERTTIGWRNLSSVI